jgi:hypothetical protein
MIMKRGAVTFCVTGSLLVTGCIGEAGKLEIRTLADPLTAAAKRGSPMIVEGRAMLALGNAGLALEAFRKALREQPGSIEALAGIAACYDEMGRYDLSRSYFEEALANAPKDPVLLNTFAASLERQGRRTEAVSLRLEAASAASSLPALPVEPASATPTPAAAPIPVVPTVIEPPKPIPQPTQQARATPAPPPAVAPAAPAAPAPTAPTASAPLRAANVSAPIPTASSAAQPHGTTEWRIEPAVSQSVAVSLPKTQPVATLRSARLAAADIRIAQPSQSVRPPRLERLSLGEVALLTGDKPAWKPQVVAKSAQSVTVRFVPLQSASAASKPRFVPLQYAAAYSKVRILNAARRQGVAARTRQYLVGQGWRGVQIGDAARPRFRSLVLYPRSQQLAARRLAARLGIRNLASSRGNQVVVLLGRDVSTLRPIRLRG